MICLHNKLTTYIANSEDLGGRVVGRGQNVAVDGGQRDVWEWDIESHGVNNACIKTVIPRVRGSAKLRVRLVRLAVIGLDEVMVI
jgi:hypothetical protein